MRSASQGPIAFTISSIVNEPGVSIDSTQLKSMRSINYSWSCQEWFPVNHYWLRVLSIKVALIDEFPPYSHVSHVFYFREEAGRNTKKDSYKGEKSCDPSKPEHMWCQRQSLNYYTSNTLRMVPLGFPASVYFPEKEWLLHIDSISSPVNRGGPESYSACNTEVPSWTLSACVSMLIKSTVPV